MKKNINEFNQRIEIWIKNGKTNKGVNEITKTRKKITLEDLNQVIKKLLEIILNNNLYNNLLSKYSYIDTSEIKLKGNIFNCHFVFEKLFHLKLL